MNTRRDGMKRITKQAAKRNIEAIHYLALVGIVIVEEKEH